MKNLLSRKWFRRLCQCLLAVATLVILLYAAANWHGASMRRDVISRMKTEGQPVQLSDIIPKPMPPDAENFAMIPLLAEARNEWWENKPGSNHPGRPASSAISDAPLRNVGPRYTFRREDGDEAFLFWKKGLRLEGDPAACLAAYDAKLETFLPVLRAGLARPETVSPTLSRIFQKDVLNLSSGFSMSLNSLVPAFSFRTELAIRANRPDAVFESVMICLRLTETIGAEELLISAMWRGMAFNRFRPTLAKALEQGGMSREQITAIRSRLSLWDPRADYLRALDLETAWVLPIHDSFQKKRGFFPYLHAGGWNFFDATSHVLPAGWIDRSAALLIHQRLDLREGLTRAQDIKAWWDACVAPPKNTKKPTFLDGPATSTSLNNAFRGACDQTIIRHLAILACDLELHRLEHGRYPSTLAEFPGESKIDPLTHELFRYRIEGERPVIYSVGTNLKDDGGMPWQKGKPSLDVVW
ncbi:MAG: hypothetical protein EOP87_00480 [Verrucomicrobiaceae bacterium]|nr:MAG: hypothetical protein EOP87_00480 [Verrucomicrobiaceae bacterium]